MRDVLARSDGNRPKLGERQQIIRLPDLLQDLLPREAPMRPFRAEHEPPEKALLHVEHFELVEQQFGAEAEDDLLDPVPVEGLARVGVP